MKNKPKLAIHTSTASNEIDETMDLMGVPIDSFQSSDLMQMRT